MMNDDNLVHLIRHATYQLSEFRVDVLWLLEYDSTLSLD